MLMKIGLDMMGGDFAPNEAVKGVKNYLAETAASAHVFCIGDEQQIKQQLAKNTLSDQGITTIDAPQVIGMHEHPTKALKEKQQSSISIGFHLLASGKIDAFISAGNTGAMLVGALYSIKSLPGVLRPTICTIVPKLHGKTGVLLDVGLNADCKPEHLNQFAVLGSLYAKDILGIEAPTVGLLNVGEEEGKGNILAQAAYPLLKENSRINFIGNVEGRDIFLKDVDVIVCEGFTGNVILKMAESFYDIAVAQKIADSYLDKFHYENYGGTPVLGVSKPVIIGHGISKADAFSNMLLVAEKMISSNIIEEMVGSFHAEASIK